MNYYLYKITTPKMKHLLDHSSLFPYLTIIIIITSLPSLISLADSSAQKHKPFLHCLTHHLSNSSTSQLSKLTHTPNDPSFQSTLNSTIMNPRTFLYSSTPYTNKPFLIVTPFQASEVRATILCAREHGVEVRTRSGGHDSEGLSYLSSSGSEFAVIDMRNLRGVRVDAGEKTAWVDSGATLGEVYYAVAEKSRDRLAFPAGTCYTVGSGGHFGGGGYGHMLRKYGLAADNIVDALIVDAGARLLDRDSMGRDLFWAIRGGGPASFGVVLSWKIRLVEVPARVSVFSLVRDLEDKETKKLVHRWQHVAHKLPEELVLYVRVQAANSTIQAAFISVFLGSAEKLFSTVRKSFPGLGLVREDCMEMTWIDSVALGNGFPAGSPREVLLDRARAQGRPMSFAAKADFVERPVPRRALERLWESLYEDDEGVAFLQLFPYGAKMAEIPESEIPFPHRAGNLYELSYISRWDERGDFEANRRHLNWTRSVYGLMTRYVSKNPRGGYLNYRDLDLGKNGDGGERASRWARSYFKGNFERLVFVKSKVDPTDFFRNEQSIPPLIS